MSLFSSSSFGYEVQQIKLFNEYKEEVERLVNKFIVPVAAGTQTNALSFTHDFNAPSTIVLTEMSTGAIMGFKEVQRLVEEGELSKTPIPKEPKVRWSILDGQFTLQV